MHIFLVSCCLRLKVDVIMMMMIPDDDDDDDGDVDDYRDDDIDLNIIQYSYLAARLGGIKQKKSS